MRNRYYQGPITDHFDGLRFFNPRQPNSDKTLGQVIRWRLLGHRAHWPKVVPATSGLKPAQRIAGLRITLIGHASLLIQTANTNLLIDPVWSLRASPFQWIGPRRHNPPSIAFEDLPPIDFVLITHNHYDHMDTSTILRLCGSHKPKILAPLGNDRIIHGKVPTATVETGDWWDRFRLTAHLEATVVPAYHWSTRSVGDRRMALWAGFLLNTPAGLVYCGGDTAYGDGAIFREIKERCGAPSVALLPIGAYAPRWFMQSQHADPEEAMQVARDCGAGQVLGIHWHTFALTDEPYLEPAKRLATAARSHSFPEARFAAMRPGDVWEPSSPLTSG